MRYSTFLLYFLFPLCLMAEEPIAWVSFLSGKVYCSNKAEHSNCFRYKSDELVPVSSGFKFFAGDRIHVEKKSKVDIQFASGSTIRQMEGQADIEENGLDSGSMAFKAFFKITKQVSNKVFKVNSNTATAGVRGTEFFFKSESSENEDQFSIDDDGVSPGVYVTNGEVEVTPKAGCFLGLFCGETVTLEANEQVIFDENFDKQTIDPSTKAKLNAINTSQETSSDTNSNGNSCCPPCPCW